LTTSSTRQTCLKRIPFEGADKHLACVSQSVEAVDATHAHARTYARTYARTNARTHAQLHTTTWTRRIKPDICCCVFLDHHVLVLPAFRDSRWLVSVRVWCGPCIRRHLNESQKELGQVLLSSFSQIFTSKSCFFLAFLLKSAS
jgi:hypothetical protein